MPAKIFKTADIGEDITTVVVRLDSLMGVKDKSIVVDKVIGLSDCFICLGDRFFTKITVSKTFEFGYQELEKVSISESNSKFDIEYFGKFRISLHTTEKCLKRIESKINKEFNKWLDRKVGLYGRAREIKINLSEE